MKFDVEVESLCDAAVRRRLVQHEHVRKRHLPQIIVPHEHFLEHRRQIGHSPADKSAMLWWACFGATYASYAYRAK